MFLLDANVLLALVSPGHLHHRAAHAWFNRDGQPDGWATTPITEAALLRLALNPRVMGRQVLPREALSTLAGLRTQAGWHFLPDDASLAEPMIDTTPLVGHQLVTDFHLVNLAATHSATLATLDAKLRLALAPSDRCHIHCLSPTPD